MKIKSFNLVFLSLFCLTIFFSMDTIAQTFMKYQTWATEKNKDPGLNPYNPALTRLPFFYNQVFNSVSGNFNNDYDNNTPFYENIPINEIQLLVNKENILKVYSVETQPYRVLDPSMQTEGVNVNYTFASVVNNQEVLTPPRALEEKSNNPLIPIPRYDAYTTHATIERYNDIENQSYFGNLTTNPISFVVSGNFIGDMKDEIAVFQLYNGSQRLVMLKNNETSETMNYNLTVNQTETYTYTGQPALNQIKAITVGRFYNNLGLYQDIIVFSKNSGQNQIWRFKFDNGAWNLTLLNSNANMDFDNLAGVASGDFDGDVDDVACLYNSSSNSQQINIYYNNNFAANPPNVYNRSNTILDFSKIEHLVAGNYNDSLDVNNHQPDEIAVLVDYGSGIETTGKEALQEIIVFDHNSGTNGWYFKSVASEHRSNLNFDKEKTKFIYSEDFDRDTKRRDDIGIFYLGDDVDFQETFTFKKILMWLNKPDFHDNDFVMEVPNREGTGTEKFFPMGIFGTRLITDWNLSNSEFRNNYYWPNNVFPPGFTRKATWDYLSEIRKYFNTLIIDRINYTDALSDYTARGFGDRYTPYITNSKYDFWLNMTDQNGEPFRGYILALRHYLDSADSYNMKVMPRLCPNHMYLYDDSIANSNYFAKVNKFFPVDTLPTFILDNVSDTYINNHYAFLGWALYDEPDCFRATGEIGEDFFDYNNHYARIEYQNTTVIPRISDVRDRLPYTKDMLERYYQRVRSITNEITTIDKPIFVNFNANKLDFDYFVNSYDIPSFDSYPFGSTREYATLSGYTSVSKDIMESVIKYNKPAAFSFFQGLGYEIKVWNKETLTWDHPTGSPDFYTQRFSLFSQAIEGIRGFQLFDQEHINSNDTIHGSTLLAVKEFNHYIPFFELENMNQKVSTNYDRLISADYAGDGYNFTHFNHLNYSIHYDPILNIYLLFIANSNFNQSLSNLTFTISLGVNEISNNVYLLASDYFENGLYNQINSSINTGGNYVQFTINNIKKSEIQIYSIGGRPTVTTIAQEKDFKGFLSYSNQSKLICYPSVQTNALDSGSNEIVRYHAAYHRPVYPGSNRYGIFYRQSHPMNYKTPEELIDWEDTDSPVSGTIIDVINQITTEANCKYPSIVVRFDDLTNPPSPRVYIVYTCKGEDNFNYIVENHFPVGTTPGPVGHLLARSIGQDMDKWGTPVVNASIPGNYYAWSDEISGIKVGWKPTNALYFNTIDTISFKWNTIVASQATHPSLNVYSRLWLSEDDCALVWVEHPFDESRLSDVCYTRIRKNPNNGSLIHYVPSATALCNPGADLGTVNATNDILKITNANTQWNYYYNALPVIYRNIGFDNNDTYYDFADFHQDRIYWHCVDSYLNNILAYAYIEMNDFYDSNFGTRVPLCWDRDALSSIKSVNNLVLFSPVVSQGSLRRTNNVSDDPNIPTPTPKYSNMSDSTIVLNFISKSSTSSTDYKIWQINHSTESLINSWETLTNRFELYKYSSPLIGIGYLPHLSFMPSVTGRKEWLNNRRIFETNIGSPPEIASSVYLFAKRRLDDPESILPFFGFINENRRTMFAPVWFSDENDKIFMPKINFRKQGNYRNIIRDTIYSDWFKIDEVKDLNILRFSNSNSLFDLSIERKDNGRSYNIPLNQLNDSLFTKSRFKLINGRDREYRFRWIKRDNDTKYSEQLVIGGIPIDRLDERDIDTARFEKGIVFADEGVINLSDDEFYLGNSSNINLSIVPNPASEDVLLSAQFPVSVSGIKADNTITLTVYLSIGQYVNSFSIKPGQTLRFPVSDFPQGVYFIRAEVSEIKLRDSVLPTVRQIVIER